ncbi:MAG: DUF4936 family protein [Rubrivivax sp.]|nr:DUF4936 family protein [Rubrivivax sp.]MDP3222000.1 DUF4936 family protein [Rubrivivax sp.]MDP3615506.1 DUF4936 family protein [Rubrivivax sp.]
MSRELFIYWRVQAQQLQLAVQAMARFQGELCARQPQLQARLFKRVDEDQALATLMETYAAPGGIDNSLHQAIVVQGTQAAAPWCQGPRHVEVFEPAGG